MTKSTTSAVSKPFLHPPRSRARRLTSLVAMARRAFPETQVLARLRYSRVGATAETEVRRVAGARKLLVISRALILGTPSMWLARSDIRLVMAAASSS
ncbi:hypothetical protein BC936DRAFT_137959 [Jimgerdemannia flammicorona]|uniref:Uncharacterized protein n=1 Tax=Jimgerdemannia flammicorona TaxID=994334 RepID=A0A433CW50_9FUNG|nr:hypothetical protein BC936DRAFT_137959 [Jimgerdemannia flammicorona]